MMLRGVAAFVAALWLTGTAFAYDYRDAVEGIAPDGRGVDAAITFVSYLQDVFTVAKADNEAEEFFRFLLDNASDFSFGTLYKNKQMSDWPNGYRGVTFRADFIPGQYSYRMVPHDPTLVDRSDLSGMGAFIAEFGLRKNKNSPAGGSSYSLLFEGDATSAHLSHVNLLKLLDNLMRVIDPENLEVLRWENGVRQDEPFDVLTQFKKNFPKFASLNGIADIRSTSRIIDGPSARFNDFSLRLALHPDRLKELYPAFARYMKKLKDPGNIEFTLLNKEGHVLTSFGIDPENQVLKLAVCTRAGLVIPTSREEGRVVPYPEEAFLLSGLRDYAWDTRVTVYNLSRGIRFFMDDVAVDGKYEYDGRDMMFTLKLADVPHPQISGAAYGIIPLWVFDLFIPGNIQSLAEDFAEVMYKANYGMGTYFKLDWHKRDPSFWWLHWTAETEVIDSWLVRLGARTISRRFKMTGSQMDQAFALAETSVGYLLEDLEAMKH